MHKNKMCKLGLFPLLSETYHKTLEIATRKLSLVRDAVRYFQRFTDSLAFCGPTVIKYSVKYLIAWQNSVKNEMAYVRGMPTQQKCSCNYSVHIEFLSVLEKFSSHRIYFKTLFITFYVNKTIKRFFSIVYWNDLMLFYF